MAVIKAQNDKNILIFDSFKQVKRNFESYFSNAKFLIFCMFFASFFSPLLWFFFFFSLIILFNSKIWSRYFRNRIMFVNYIDKFSCPFADNGTGVFSKFGYTIDYESEWEEHYARLKGYTLPDDSNIDKNEIKSLADDLAKEAKRVKNSQSYRESGIGKDLATRHILFIGTTGAGKTETLLTFFDDIVNKKNSGGIIVIDGKADSKIHTKLSSIIAKHNRMTSFSTINLLKQEKMSTTNTYNPILSMSPFKGVSFMGSLLPSEGGGNADYFKQRGIAMLTIPLSALKIRNEFFHEPFSLSLLQDSTSSLNITILYCLFYGIVREENGKLKKLIETNEKVRNLWHEAKDKSTAVNQDMQYYEKFLNYVTQYKPSAKTEIENIIGYDFRLFHMAYNMVFKLARAYMSEIFNEWREMSNVVAETLYVYAKEVKNREFTVLSMDSISLEDLRGYFADLSEEKNIEITLSKTDFDSKKMELLKNALGYNPKAQATLYKLPEDAIQQHRYSQQQFTALFQTFERFPHVFGSPFPDVEMKDQIKNNKILYVMLPVLELGDDMSKLLGKMIIRDMQESGSVSLGGENLTITPTQDNIAKDKVTPKPLSVFVADEYGYYRVEEDTMSAILAQFRSLNFCAILSLQDVAGLGTDENTQKALANTSKYILKSYDTKIKEFMDAQVSEVEVIEKEKYLNSSGNIVNSDIDNIKINKTKIIDSTILNNLNYGCGIYIANSKPQIIQSYYFGGKEVEPYIASMTRYSA